MQRLRVGIDARLAGRGLGISTALAGLVTVLAGRVDIVWFGDPDAAPAGIAASVRVRGPYPVLDTRVGHRLVRDSKVDLFHFAANTGWGRAGPVPTVLTVHDLIFFDSAIRGRSLRQIVGHRYARWSTRRAARVATAIAVPTFATAGDVERTLATPVPPTVIPWGIDPQPITHSRPADPPSPYLLAFSARDPRKGTELVLEAWRALGADRPQLWLLAGAGVPPWLMRRAGTEVEAGEIRLIDYVPRADLTDIVAGARALVYPSTAEGFGFPVLEAMALGVPVVSGLSPATREVGGEAIVRIDPGDALGSTRRALLRLGADPAFRTDVVERGLKRVRDFRWDAAAERYLRLYQEAVAAAPGS